MSQKDKELLLKDLCGRVPYGVKCKYNDGVIVNILSVNFFYKQIEGWERYVNHTLKYDVEDVKQYLFPLSSMTEKQKNEIIDLGWSFDNDDSRICNILECFGTYRAYVDHSCCFELIDWCIKNHFDYRGLIPMGLAIDATGKNIY